MMRRWPVVLGMLVLGSCTPGPDSLVLVGITAPEPLPTVENVILRVGGTSKTYPTQGKLGPQPLYRGLYIPGDELGPVVVHVQAIGSAGCPSWQGDAASVHVSHAGVSVMTTARLMLVTACPATDAGGRDAGVDLVTDDARPAMEAAVSDGPSDAAVDGPAMQEPPDAAPDAETDAARPTDAQSDHHAGEDAGEDVVEDAAAADDAL